jgi:hypothetical protein
MLQGQLTRLVDKHVDQGDTGTLTVSHNVAVDRYRY